jgi:hypothetical protein
MYRLHVIHSEHSAGVRVREALRLCSFENIEKNCSKDFNKYRECLDKRNLDYASCRRLEAKFNECTEMKLPK